MQNRTIKVAILAVLATVLVLSFSGVALADQTWRDLPDTVTAKYGITDNQVASISDGFVGGLWKPFQNVTRAQFIKMAVATFDIPLANPATPTFTDVPKTNYYYQWIEGAKAAHVANGFTATTFGPNDNITREQALAIIVRYLARVNGYDLATMYTAAEVNAILARFGDAASVGSALKTEVAFAIDFAITVGNDFGNIDPQGKLTRIQGAAFLIRSQAKVPPAPVVPVKIELVSADKSENLIGQNHQVTFKATVAGGQPAAGVLVDFDTLSDGPFEVGNISPEAAMTNSIGEVTVNMLSTEPGTQRMSAAVVGLAAVYTTKYWLVLDEVYITDLTGEAENNVGEAHTWGARVVVFGPGPRSTSIQDWYNAISTAPFDPTDINVDDGVDELDGWDYAYEKHLLAFEDETPRTLAGITVNWSIVDWFSPSVVPALALSDSDRTKFDPYNYGPIAGRNYVGLTTNAGTRTVTSVKFGNLDAILGDQGSNYVDVRVPAVSLTKNVEVIVYYSDGTSETVGTYWYIAAFDVAHASVGNITAVDGVAMTAAKTAVGVTDAAGLSTIKIESTVTGKTYVQAIANYAGNPYPKQLFNHSSFGGDWFNWIAGFPHDVDWDDQPVAFAIKTWIPHVIGDGDAPITAASLVNNTGEVETFTLTLEDTFGNVIPGYTVEWWIQGVGLFKTDGSTWVGTGEQNKDVDITDAVTGQASVSVKSLDPGQTIVHVKVMDKYGLPYQEWNVVKQWYSIDDVSFLPTTDADGLPIPAANVVNDPHTFTVEVSGAKYVYTIYDLNTNGLRDDEVLIGDRADMAAAAGVYAAFDGSVAGTKLAGVDPAVGIPFQVTNGNTWYIRFADMNMAANEFWANRIGTVGINPAVADTIDEVWASLAGKGVNFFTNIGSGGTPTSNTALPTETSGTTYPNFVGTITGSTTPWTDITVGGTLYHYNAVTDADGQATVTVNSTAKGNQWVYAVADYPENPQDGNAALPLQWHELRWDSALKTWLGEAGGVSIKTFNGDLIEGDRWVNPVLDFAGYTQTGGADVVIGAPNGTQATATATVGTGAVTGFTALVGGGGYTSVPLVTIAAPPGAGATATATLSSNTVSAIAVTNSGSGYLAVPGVTIAAPPTGTTATATAVLTGTVVTSITVTNVGTGYITAPAITISSGTTATATATVVGGVVTGFTGLVGGSGYVGAPTVTIAAPVMTQATATATVLGGVINSITLTNGGSGYATAPAVTFSGTGFGAAATATIANGAVTGFTGLVGGGGYTGITTDPAPSNPNTETIAVQVFDTFGNALEGYKVTWEIVRQHTTTSGTEPTYHPYAHFRNDNVTLPDGTPAHDNPLSPFTAAGVGDLNPFVNSNLIWDSSATLGQLDDDYAWGWTLDHQINFTKNLASAAYATLVLDETRAQLIASGATHFSNIVNIKVYTPAGALYDEFEVTKVWTLDTPLITSKVLSISATGLPGSWVTTLSTNNSPIYYQILLLDQFGNPYTALDPNLKLAVSGPSAVVPIDLGTFSPINGYVSGFFTPPSGGTWTLTAWNDTNGNDAITPLEITSNPAVLTFTGTVPVPVDGM